MNWAVKKASMATKMRLLCGLFFAPIALLMYWTVTAYQKDISFAELEINGVEFIDPAVHLLAALTSHRLAVEAQEQYKIDMKDEIEQTTTKAKEQSARLTSVNKRLGDILQFTERGLSQRKRDGNTVAYVTDLVENIIQGRTEKHEKGINAIKTLITHAGDTSNLVLDPDLDSYYLMDFVIIAAPILIDRLQTIHSHVREAFSSGTVAPELKVQLAIDRVMLNDVDLSRIDGDINTAINEDSNYYGSNDTLQKVVASKFKALSAQIKDFSQVLSDFETKGKSSITWQDYEDLSNLVSMGTLDLWSTSSQTLTELLKSRTESYLSMQRKTLVTSFIALLILGVLAWWATRGISRTLAHSVEDVAKQSDVIKQVASVIEITAQQLASSANQQAAAIEETVSGMEEMTAMLGQTNKSAQDCTRLTERGKHDAEVGNSVISELTQAMQDIGTANSKLQELVTLIGEIRDKTNVINDIVFETRILSFNASIEAARAGVHGRGFAVVAEEVGKLATMSGNAAAEIRNLLTHSTEQVEKTVSGTQSSVDRSLKASKDAAQQFSIMMNNLDQILAAVTNISSATREQEIGVKQTTTAMSEMDSLTQKNSNSASEMSDQSERMKSCTLSLSDVILELKHTVFGRNLETKPQVMLTLTPKVGPNREDNHFTKNSLRKAA